MYMYKRIFLSVPWSVVWPKKSLDVKSDPGKSILLVETQGQTHVRLTMELIFRD